VLLSAVSVLWLVLEGTRMYEQEAAEEEEAVVPALL